MTEIKMNLNNKKNVSMLLKAIRESSLGLEIEYNKNLYSGNSMYYFLSSANFDSSAIVRICRSEFQTQKLLSMFEKE